MAPDVLNRISAALPRLAVKIAADQGPDGGFASLSSADDSFTKTVEYQTTFFPALIASSINSCSEPILEPVKNKLAGFLLAQKSSGWSFNYWDRSSAEFIGKPYPDDLDDTFCALGALAALRPATINGEALAAAVSLLTAVEVRPGGPYRTWLVEPGAPSIWRDVDLAVNCNISWFLAGQQVSLPSLAAFIEDNIRGLSFHSPYYPSSSPILYYLSRAYNGPLTGRAVQFLLGQKTAASTWDNGLNTALAVVSLLRFGYDPGKLEKPVEMLLSLSKKGEFLPQPFCFDPAVEGHSYMAGSEALTAALYLEALTLYGQTASSKHPAKTLVQGRPDPQDIIYDASVALVRGRFSKLDKAMQLQASEVLANMLAKDTDQQIVLLPYFFADACGMAEQLGRQFLTGLGAAGLYGWIAYTIYDNVIDEMREIKLIPLANICSRETAAIYTRLGAGFWPLFEKVMDKMEAANAWEMANTRGNLLDQLPDYGDYGILADKSLGHILGPLAIVYKLGFGDVSSAELAATEQLFKHYLIARQLNDDAHDWQEDLQKGQVNSVAVIILRDWRKQRIGRRNVKNLDSVLPELQKLFWNETIHEIGRLILRHTAEARQQASRLEFLENPGFLEAMLEPLESAVSKAETESAKAADFLRSYRPT